MSNKLHSSSANLSLRTLIWVSILLFGLVASCSTPIGTLRPAGSSGSLSLSVPHIASWVSSQMPTQNLASGSRAYIFADSVKVEVKTADGTEVVPAVTADWAIGPDYSPAFPSVMSTINGIPGGTNYTVVISIFNKAVSDTVPQVQGQTTGVTVVDGEVTPVNVICKPVNPIPLTVDGGYLTDTIAPNGERWYVVNVTAGTSYYFDSLGPAALFDQNGVVFQRFYVPQLIDYTGPLYIGAVDFNGFAGFSALGETSVQLSTVSPVISEGTTSSPVLVTLDSDRRFALSASSSNTPSYYSFETSEAGTYAFDTEFYSLSFSLYSDSTYSGTPLVSGSDVYSGGSFPSLAANTIYYLKVINPNSSASRAQGRILTPTAIAQATLSEGTSSSPVSLNLAAEETGTVGYHVFDSKSYYTFTTDANGHTDVTLSVTGSDAHPVGLALDNAPITSDWGSDFSIVTSTTGHIYAQLLPDTVYYLRVANDLSTGVRTNRSANYTIQVTTSASAPAGVSEGSLDSPYPLVVGTDHTFSVGAYNSGYSTSYYRFDTDEAGDYAVDYNGGSGTATLYSDASFTVFIKSYGSGVGGVFTGLSGSTTYYLKLSNNSSARLLMPGRLVDAAEMEANRVSDGTLALPYQLFVGTLRSGFLGKHSYDYQGYYRFTTGDELDYQITSPGSAKPYRLELHEYPSFTSYLDSTYLDPSTSLQEILRPQTTYYLRIANLDISSDTVDPFTVLVAATAPPSFVSLPVQEDATTGAISTPYSVVWYEADVVGGSSYRLTWASGSVGTIAATALQADRSTSYFVEQQSYNSPRTIAVPAGETKLYVRMRVPYGSSNTGTFTVKLESLP